jgi:hypothetical protein
MDATLAAQLKTPAQRPGEGAQDGLSPAAHVGSVEEQGGRGGLSAEVEVFSVKREVRGGLEAAEKAARPTVATVEGAALEVTAAVCEVVGRVFWPGCTVGCGGGGRVGYGL